MEVLYLYGNKQQKKEWLEPLLEGKIRSCFGMTGLSLSLTHTHTNTHIHTHTIEPAVASSDATNMQCTIKLDSTGDWYIVNGRKWWTSGAGDPRCAVAIVMGVTNPDADRLHRHSMILVPMATPGVNIIRPLTVFGYYGRREGEERIIQCVCVCVCVRVRACVHTPKLLHESVVHTYTHSHMCVCMCM